MGYSNEFKAILNEAQFVKEILAIGMTQKEEPVMQEKEYIINLLHAFLQG